MIFSSYCTNIFRFVDRTVISHYSVFKIQLRNVNDLRPKIDKTNLPSDIDLPENESNNSIITISASDEDNLGPLKFSIEGIDEESSPFHLIEGPVHDSRVLTVDGDLLDFEERQFWSLQILVQVLHSVLNTVSNKNTHLADFETCVFRGYLWSHIYLHPCLKSFQMKK